TAVCSRLSPGSTVPLGRHQMSSSARGKSKIRSPGPTTTAPLEAVGFVGLPLRGGPLRMRARWAAPTFAAFPRSVLSVGSARRPRPTGRRRPTPHDVRDEHRPAGEPRARQRLVKDLPRGPDERLTAGILLTAGRLTNKEYGGIERAHSGDREVSAFVKPAQRAGSDLGGRLLQEFGALLVW